MLILLNTVMLQCDLSTNTEVRGNTVSSFSSSWSFAGFRVGETSGDFYHLLSSIGDNSCALVRENANGTMVYAQMYSVDICFNLDVDSSETNAYFANTFDSSTQTNAWMSIAKVTAATGAMQVYTSMHST